MKIIFIFYLLCIDIFAVSVQNIEAKIGLLRMNNKDNFRDLKIKYDPFLYVVHTNNKILYKKINQVRKTKKTFLQLYAIFDNQAFINGKWYHQGEKIDKYIVYKIYNKEVFLKNSNKIIALRLKATKNILNIKEKKR